MFNEPDDIEDPVSVVVRVNSGQTYDLKNLPGAKRKQLIDAGEISIDKFVQADNMPGYKLKLMRDRFKINNPQLAESNTSVAEIDITKLQKGDLVSYKNIVTPVKDINMKKNLVNIDIKGKIKGWVSINKLKPVNIPPESNEEE
jgi:hypothetical protein